MDRRSHVAHLSARLEALDHEMSRSGSTAEGTRAIGNDEGDELIDLDDPNGILGGRAVGFYP